MQPAEDTEQYKCPGEQGKGQSQAQRGSLREQGVKEGLKAERKSELQQSSGKENPRQRKVKKSHQWPSER